MDDPTQIGRYEIKSELGRGGMAIVYRAYDPSFEREVAIKILPRDMIHDMQFRPRFEREIKLVAGLEHPSIVPVYDVGNEDGQPYYVMRYMTGGSLSARIKMGRISIQDTARIVEKIAHGLDYAHRKGIIHRDLKPDNILFDNNDDPFISDFGIAKLMESSSSLTGTGVIGTPAYMSPEQAKGDEVDGRSDIYGLGIIVYQMLSGQQPYNADTPIGVLIKHLTEPVPQILKAVPDLPHKADDVIKSSMAKDRDERYSSALELAKELNLAAFGHEGNTTPTPKTGRHKPPAIQLSHARAGLAAVAGIVLLVAIVGFLLLSNQLFTAPQATSTLEIVPTAAASEIPTEEIIPTLVPACAAGIAIPTPVVKETNKVCVTKIPYTAISIPEGATFESLSPKLTCAMETTINGNTIISCRGPQLFSYNLKVCVPPVVSDADLGKCAQGGIFDSANQCCVASPPDGAGCAIFKVDLRACQ